MAGTFGLAAAATGGAACAGLPIPRSLGVKLPFVAPPFSLALGNSSSINTAFGSRLYLLAGLLFPFRSFLHFGKDGLKREIDGREGEREGYKKGDMRIDR